MASGYCVTCNRVVEGKKNFSWLKFFFCGGPIYLIWFLIKKPTCPICGSKVHKHKP